MAFKDKVGNDEGDKVSYKVILDITVFVKVPDPELDGVSREERIRPCENETVVDTDSHALGDCVWV